MGVIFSMALNMYRSLHLIISYLLRDDKEKLEDKSQDSIGNIEVDG